MKIDDIKDDMVIYSISKPPPRSLLATIRVSSFSVGHHALRAIVVACIGLFIITIAVGRQARCHERTSAHAIRSPLWQSQPAELAEDSLHFCISQVSLPCVYGNSLRPHLWVSSPQSHCPLSSLFSQNIGRAPLSSGKMYFDNPVNRA